jgi:hypothetical protein
VTVAAITCCLIVLDVTYAPLRTWWERHPFTTSVVAGVLVLLPYLEPAYRAQLAHAVGHVGLIGALRRISGEGRRPATGGLP